MVQTVPLREGRFVMDAEGGKLLGNKCKSCGRLYFPKVQFCFECFSKDLEEIVLSRRGKLYTYTTCYYPSAHFPAPYTIGFVDLTDGVRVFAPLIPVEGKPFKLGIDMELVIEELYQENDTQVIGYKFKPV
jgi:uncharacterized OB-fold protein